MGAEGLRPAFWRQLIDLAVRVRGEAQQDVLQIRERCDVGEFAALDERVQQRGAASAFKAAGEEPILSTNGHDAELVLGPIVVDGDAAILDEALQRRPLIREISDRVAEWGFRQDSPGEGLPFSVDLREQGNRVLLAERKAPSINNVYISSRGLMT